MPTNNTGSTITKGSAVYISGSDEITLADANASSTMPCAGLADADIADGASGTVRVSGLLENVDTSAFTVGDALYVSGTAGALTETAPTGATDVIQVVGYVVTVNASTGSILVRPEASGTRVIEPIILAVSDETTDLTTGTGKITFRAPYAFTLTDVRASVSTAPTGAALTVDINEGGVSVLSTKLTIDASETTSTTAATAAVISDSAIADDAEITVDIDQIGSTVAGQGLKIALYGYR